MVAPAPTSPRGVPAVAYLSPELDAETDALLERTAHLERGSAWRLVARGPHGEPQYERWCPRCVEWRPAATFTPTAPYCRPCMTAYCRERLTDVCDCGRRKDRRARRCQSCQVADANRAGGPRGAARPGSRIHRGLWT